MESIQQIQQQITETEQKTITSQAIFAEHEKDVLQLNQQLLELQKSIDSILIQPCIIDRQTLGTQRNIVEININFVRQNLAKEVEAITSQKEAKLAEIQKLILAQNKLTSTLNETFSLDEENVTKEKALLQILSNKVQKETELLNTLTAENLNQENKLIQLQKSIEKQKQQYCARQHQVDLHSQDFANLQKQLIAELKLLNQQLSILQTSIIQENIINIKEAKQKNDQLQKEKIQLMNQQCIQQKNLQINAALEQKLRETNDIQSLLKNKGADVSSALSNIESNQSILQKQLNLISAQNKQISEQIKQQELILKQESKQTKHKKNYKQIFATQSKQNELLLKAHQREKQRLTETSILKSTYVDPKSLEILKKQYERVKLVNSPSLQVKQIQKIRLMKQNQYLKGAILKLKRSDKQGQQREQKNLSETNKKGEGLIHDTQTIDKIIDNHTFKLFQYKKMFPHHQEEKQIKKIEIARLKRQEKQREHHQKAEHKANAIIKARMMKEEQEHAKASTIDGSFAEEGHLQQSENITSSQVFKKTRWYKRQSFDNFDMEPDKPFYKNSYLQAAFVMLISLLIIFLANL